MTVQRTDPRDRRFPKAKTSLLIALLLVVLAAACRPADTADQPTPTPFPQIIPAQRVTTAAPIPITLANLAANPDFYVGATLQLSGRFQRLPRRACEGAAYPSPATWGLEADGLLANAAGMDEQLRALLDEGQQITVEGRWLRFEGPVGCAGNEQEQTIWYLSTDRVLDPHPLVRIQNGGALDLPVPTDATEIAQTQPTTTPLQPPATAEPAAPPTALPSLTPESAATATISSEAITATVDPAETATTLTPTTSATAPGGNLVPTVTIQGTSVPGSGLTPTGTPDGNSDQATATMTVTAGPSATPSSSLTVDKGSLEIEDLVIDSLGAGETDRWKLDLVGGDAITLTVAPGSTANIVLSLQDANGTMLVNAKNSAAGGEVETILNRTIAEPGIYNLLISSVQGAETDYAVMFMDAESYSFIFRGQILVGNSLSDTLAADTDHFWFFNALSGESVSFSITPDSGSDPYIEVYDPEGSRMLTIDDTGEGEAESLDTYTLLDEGMYAIRVAEFDFRPMSYQIRLSKP